ncbi:MAG: hypothetical protein HY735_14140 [Verrucomicrobia bacterium]|nr:hypothetical protein [Verrucomicrobiota bacterium]
MSVQAKQFEAGKQGAVVSPALDAKENDVAGTLNTWTSEGRAPYGEADTRAKLIDPALHERGWTEEHIRREQTPGGIQVVDGVWRRLSQKHIDYVLRVKVGTSTQPVAVGYVEAKSEDKPPEAGLQQVKDYATTADRLHVPFVFSTNGHLFIE